MMKFIVSKSELFNNLQLLSKVVPSRATIPIIETFLFELQGNNLKITATDLESTITLNMEVEMSEGEGKACLQARKLMEVLKEFPEQPLEFDITADQDEAIKLIIKTDSGKYELPSYEADDFPSPTELVPETTKELTIPAEVLYRGITKTFFAIGDDDLRPQINGINFDLRSDSLTFVSTDAHKLVVFKRTDYSYEEPGSFILRKKPADLLKNITAKMEGDVNIKFDEKNVIFNMTNITLSAQLQHGQYPDYQAFIPTNNDKQVIVDREGLLSRIKRVALFANETTKLVILDFKNNELEISAQDIDFSTSAYEKMSCNQQGEAIRIGFRSTFLIDILSNIESQEVTIEMSSPQKAALIYPTVPEYEEENELMLVMPLTIS